MKRRGISALLLAAVLLSLSLSAGASAVVQPSFQVWVSNGPLTDDADFHLAIWTSEGMVCGLKYYAKRDSAAVWAVGDPNFRSRIGSGSAYLAAEYKGVRRDFELTQPLLSRYEIKLALDWRSGELSLKKTARGGRILEAAARLLLTLLLEGAVFYLFGYRAKRSWIVFFITNFATQIVLSVLMVQMIWRSAGILASFWLLELYLMIFELAVYYFALREWDKGRACLSAVCTNLVSVTFGSVLLTLGAHFLG